MFLQPAKFHASFISWTISRNIARGSLTTMTYDIKLRILWDESGTLSDKWSIDGVSMNALSLAYGGHRAHEYGVKM